MARVLGALLGWLVGSVLRIRRAHVADAMRRAGIDPDLATAFYRSLGRSVFELLWPAKAVTDEASMRRLRAAIARGRGVVLAASHTGNFELAARHAATLVPLLAITKRQSVRIADRIVQALRGRHAVRTHRGSGALRAARAHLASGGAVAMVIDQVPDRRSNAERLPFLGTGAWVDRAPFVLAARARCPLVVTAAHRDAEGIQRVVVLDVIEPQGQIEEAMRRATNALEVFVRAHPTEWLWMHRRWKEIPPPSGLLTSAS